MTNLFDITQGRSVGIQVQAVSRAGTNALSGSLYGNMRDDRLNAADHLAGRVLPFQNQQYGGAVGGPIVQNKTHYFLTYEYEREPGTTFSQPARLPNQSFTFATKDTHHSGLARVDHEFSSRDRLMVRASMWDYANPFTGGDGASEIHPSEGAERLQSSQNASVSWTRVYTDNLVQEVRFGRSGFAWANNVAVQRILDLNTPSYSFPGLYVGGRLNYNQDFTQETWSARYDLAWHRGNHALKFGAEFLRWHDVGGYRPARNARGQFTFHSVPPDLERRFPADSWDDPTRWDVSGLEPYVTRFDQGFGDGSIDIPRPNYALWFGDTLRATDRLTVNYGVRYDIDWGMMAPPRLKESPSLHEWQETDIRDLNNFAPRAGFNYRVTENSVIRGGSGMYYGTHHSQFSFDIQRANSGREVVATFLYDGMPGFMEDPRRGVTGEDIVAGRVPSPRVSTVVVAPNHQFPRSWQNMLGFQKQVSQVIGLEADLTYTQLSHEQRNRDRNLFQDPVTGYSLNPQVHGRPFPRYEGISWRESTGVGHEVTLATGLTRRYRDNFQGGATYTLMLYKKDDFAYDDVFDLNPPLSTSNAFQRHTLRLNGLYQLPWGFNVSGAYFFGSGNRYGTSISGRPFGSVGGGRLNTGAPIHIRESMLKRWDGPAVIGTMEFVPRNGLKGTALHKVDLRVSKDFRLGGNVKLTGMVEAFNVLNHANYGQFVTPVNLSSFGNPRQRLGNAYAPRMGQLAFRLTF
ncbi:hypothetical protein BH23BAC4_BH23BAC4_12260 [soil metagenome]